MLAIKRLEGLVLLASDDPCQSLAPIGSHLAYAPQRMDALSSVEDDVCEYDTLDAVVEHAGRMGAADIPFFSYASAAEEGDMPAPSAVTQWGIISRSGSRCVYAPTVEWEFIPAHARSFFGGLTQTARELNDAVYRLLYEARTIDEAHLPLLHAFCAVDGFISALEFEWRYLARPQQRSTRAHRSAPSSRVQPRDNAEIMIHYNALRQHSANASRSDLLAELSHMSGLRLVPFRYINACYAICTAGDLNTLLGKLHASLDPSYVWAAPIRRVPRTGISPIVLPSRSATMPNLEQIRAPEAWDQSRGAGVRVGIIDTGIDYSHPEVSGRFNPNKLGYDFINDGHDPADRHGHGTHVAGILAGESIGVSPEVTLYSLRALNEDGMGTEVSIIRAIEWGIEEGLDILNMSLGAPQSTYAEEEAVRLAAQFGIAVIAAAGNAGREEYNYPASYPQAISVAAVDGQNRHAEFSNANDAIAICAPGVEILSSWPGGGYAVLSGTSMSTPHVSGAAALALSVAGRRPEKLKEDIMASAKALDAGEYGSRLFFGAGLVRANRLVSGTF